MKADARATPETAVSIGERPLTIEDVVALARGSAHPVLDTSPAVIGRIRASVAALDRRFERGETIYGVTTGFGESCQTGVPGEHALELPRNLVRFHGCGTGRTLDDGAAAAVIAVRLSTLARGHSGVRQELVEFLCALLAKRVLPVIPEEGSVGASGDLTPLSYLAALVIGERQARYNGETLPAAEALARARLSPLQLRPKESLALMNGTSVMTALACLAFERARLLARAASTITAIASDVMHGDPGHFDRRIFDAKPHPGQALCARWIREHLEPDAPNGRRPARVQDRYSIRCAPHVIGVLLDALPSYRRMIEIEVNGANDNPLIDPETGDVLHGGNFYGGHIAFAMDGLKTAVANVADLLDRQLALLCNETTSQGLPSNLVARTTADRVAHHGFKAMQISASALTAEALKLTMPASVFSRSTECHNQDKVSMGTIASRDALRVLELTERVTAIALLAVCQAADLRTPETCRPRTREVLAEVRRTVPMNTADRRQDVDIEAVVRHMLGCELQLGSPEEP
ncbi:HAL/PAL/TAL family ammonia-lyase [Anaeromyxobacter oryzisoli]|uniref:HAL/PAL/TAL family ammonia-lyase n=1 Tax=Anaeromyxobacter oryzisoli TaxID=2925408 RepID=UPI001F586979|nr:aromatic amino acid ammonia-lyase [Anaeromyxobacter sp. SG63]